MTSRLDFLRSEFRMLSFMGASQHVAIYAEGSDEGIRKAFRAGLYTKLESFAQPYSRAEFDEDEHIANVQRFAGELSDEFGSTLKGRRFLIGPAQKALNLYLKYLWCAGWIPRPPHCPVDALVLSEANHVGIRWSKMDSIHAYQEAIAILRQAAGDMPLAEWELEAWRRAKARASPGAPQDEPCLSHKPAKQANSPSAGMFTSILWTLMLCATTIPEAASAQTNGRNEHMEYGISTPQRLIAAEEALRHDTFPELNIRANVENSVAIATACEKYPRGPVRQVCADAGKVRHLDSSRTAQATETTSPQRSIAEQAREIQAATAASEAATAHKEARQEHVRELTGQLSGLEEQNAYGRCMKERDLGEASNPSPRDTRDRRPSESAIPPADIVETCVAESKQRVAEEKRRSAEAAAALVERKQAERAQLTRCENSAAARMVRAANAIVMYRGFINMAKEQLERDKQIEGASGVVDLEVRRNAGEMLVDAPAEIEREFEVYRDAGGDAHSPGEVHGMDDPCKALR